MNRKTLSLLILALAITFVSTACPRRPSNEKHYDLKGKVVAVDTANRTATIAHEDIPGYMPAMTMPFYVKDESDFEILKPGDLITTTLVVQGSSSWIQESVITEGVPPDSETMDVPGEPKRGDDTPDFRLTNQDGKRIHLGQYHGKALVLTFIYTRCPLPDYCPLMSENFHQIDQELAKDAALYAGTHLLSISFDTEYDTPKVLRSYGAAYTHQYSAETFEHWEFATGTEDEIKGVARFFGLRYFHDTETGKDQVIHTLRTAAIGPNGKLIKLYRENKWKPEEIVADLRAAMAK